MSQPETTKSVNFLLNLPTAAPRKRPHKVRDKNPPNAFLLFCRDRRRDLCSKCPTLKAPEVTALLSHLWRTLDADSKEHYRQSALSMSRETVGAPEPERHNTLLNKSKESSTKRVHFPMLEPHEIGPMWCNFSLGNIPGTEVTLQSVPPR